MFYLQEILNDLAYGELANIRLGSVLLGPDAVDYYPKMVSAINLGLLDLYTRFQFKKKTLILYERKDKTLYYLRSSHLGDPTGTDEEIYIDNRMDDPPAGDIIKLLEAFDEDENEIRINDSGYPNDIMTPELDIIKLVPGDPLRIISIDYQASYPKIVVIPLFDPATYELYFPEFLKAALYAFVASKTLKGTVSKAAENASSLRSTFYSIYESECLKIQNNNLYVPTEIKSTNFTNNGWV